MGIICVIDNLGSGGAQKQLVTLAKGFQERGHDVQFLVYHSADFFKQELLDSGIHITYISEKNYLLRLLKMRRFIRSQNPNAVLSFLQSSNFICELSGFPFRSWNLVVGERSANPNIFKSYRLKMYRWFHFFATHIVANSQRNLDMVQRLNPLLSKQKCHVIYNAVELPSIEESHIVKNRLSIVVGASHRRLKNCKVLVEALNLLTVEERKLISVSWFGDSLQKPYYDDSYPEVIKLVADYKLQETISFFSATSNLPTIMREADVVGLFSFYEGLPNVICEAMSLGKPVIASKVSDLELFLGHEPSQLINAEEVQSVVRCLRFYLNTTELERKRIGESNYRVAQANFDRNIIVDSYLNLLL